MKLGAEVYQSFEKRNEPPTAFDRTPVMGLQFWQDGAQRRMDDEPAAGDKVIVVEMAPRPFEIWFPSGSMDEPQLRVLNPEGFNYFIGTRIQPADRTDYWKVYISRTSRIQDPPVALTELDSDLYLTALVDYDQDGLADFDEFEFIHLAMN